MQQRVRRFLLMKFVIACFELFAESLPHGVLPTGIKILCLLRGHRWCVNNIGLR
jgi:hypothetical protein